ncbi:MAG TPA: hypothetical protein DIV51_08205 [Lachnospiraceae bacterium]|nr:hypothetical protein [Lachnospiraceae bacterium]
MTRKKTATAKKKQSGKLRTSANRKYKDTVFRMLFADKTNLLSLYNAMNGSDYHDPSKLQIITLENAIYIGMKNDLAFVIGTNLFLYEHQSTYNPNMPLRNLFYISSEYQKMVDSNKLYSSTLLEIPAPHFVVFYNGTTKQEDSWYNYLSDSYHNFSGIPDLELKVVTLNINKGHNKELMEQCQTLNEYAQYVEKVRTYAKENNLDNAVERAVNECIHDGILADFLTQNKSEVIAMSIFEYDEKAVRQVYYEDGLEAGLKAGRKDGIKTGILNMLRAKKYSLEEISEVFQVPVEEIEQIKNQQI